MSLCSGAHNLLRGTNCRIIFPSGLSGLYYNRPFTSGNCTRRTRRGHRRLVNTLLRTDHNKLSPVCYSADPYALHLARSLNSMHLSLCSPIHFVHARLVSQLRFAPRRTPVTIRIAYDARRLNRDRTLVSLTHGYDGGIIVPRNVRYYKFTNSGNFAAPRLGTRSLHALGSTIRCYDRKVSADHAYRVNLDRRNKVSCRDLICLISQIAQGGAKATRRPISSARLYTRR